MNYNSEGLVISLIDQHTIIDLSEISLHSIHCYLAHYLHVPQLRML